MASRAHVPQALQPVAGRHRAGRPGAPWRTEAPSSNDACGEKALLRVPFWSGSPSWQQSELHLPVTGPETCRGAMAIRTRISAGLPALPATALRKAPGHSFATRISSRPVGSGKKISALSLIWEESFGKAACPHRVSSDVTGLLSLNQGNCVRKGSCTPALRMRGPISC